MADVVISRVTSMVCSHALCVSSTKVESVRLDDVGFDDGC